MNTDEVLIRETFLKEIKVHGNIGDLNLVLRNLTKNLKTELSTKMIENMFSVTTTMYYFKDSKDKNDYYIGTEDSLLEFNRRPLCKLVKLTNIPEFIHEYQYLLFFYAENMCDGGSDYEWRPCYVGGKDFLLSRFCPQLVSGYANQKRYTSNQTNEIRYSHNGEYSYNKFLETIYESLFNKEKWKDETDTNSLYYSRLGRYLGYLIEAISKKISCNSLGSDYYCRTKKDGTDYILINSRLLNKFGSWIYLSYTVKKFYNKDTNRVSESYIEPHIINNYQEAVNGGYADITLSSIKPIQFYNDPNELIFTGDISSFDLDDSQRFQHIIEDRGDRLPQSLREKDTMEIVVRFKLCIEYALKMKEMDYNYIVPAYGIERDTIQFLIPFYDEFAPDKIPTGVIITNKIRNKWVLNTILNLSDAYDMARLLAIPASEWI